MLEILILQALAFSAQGQRQQGLLALQRALHLAEPEGPVRLFVDEGAAMRALLRQAQRAGITPAYVTRLVAAYDSGTTARPQLTSSDNALLEPLTLREREVLSPPSSYSRKGRYAITCPLLSKSWGLVTGWKPRVLLSKKAGCSESKPLT